MNTLPIMSSSLAERNLRLFETGEYHDFMIKCGSMEFKVHRNIICPQSSVLRMLCDPSWKEGSEGCATLNEQDPDIVSLALSFLYAGNYETDCICKNDSSCVTTIMEKTRLCLNCENCRKGNLLTDVRVYILGDYLDIAELKKLALNRCFHILESHFQPQLFVQAIGEALANTKNDDPGLRKQILRSCCKKYELVKKDSDLFQLLMDHEPIAWMMGIENEKSEADLLKQMSEVFCQQMELSRELENGKKDLRRAHDNLATAVRLVNGKSECRNDKCKKEFGASLETFANGYIKGLRCSRCRCRHSHID